VPEDVTRGFYPLRTSVELFRDPESPAAHVRAKVGAVLFDRLAFERGVYDVTVTEQGYSDLWRPADELSDEELGNARQLHEEGTSFQLLIGKQPGRGIPAPAEAMHPIISGGITRHYVAEWESVLRELSAFDPDWVDTVETLDNSLSGAPELSKELGKLNFAMLGDTELMPDVEQSLRSWTYKSFNRDAVLAAAGGAMLQITSQFLPMVEPSGLEATATGEIALELFAPDLSEVPWEAVLEFRDHPGSREARDRLREFEQAATASDPPDLAELRLRVGQEITRDYQQAFQDLKPSIAIEGVRQAAQLGVSAIVPIAAPAAGIMETAWDARKHRRSWRTALMKLVPPS
jgi:hypothetical protein